ncbi:YncE family protein [Paenalcaligenes sp. Me131]|uniref:YncE family protein n=1 Tax=Paenalcaligenes sp. Me131 TaxID=3392636 RepID=UPI003D2B5B39
MFVASSVRSLPRQWLCSTALVLCGVFSQPAMAVTPESAPGPEYALQVGYLEDAGEGLYEVQVNPENALVMTAVIDRAKASEDLGFVYAFDIETMEPRWKIAMPHQSFSLAQDAANHKLFVGHGKNKPLRISRINVATGELEKTGERLKVQPEGFEGTEGLRHMVYVPEANALFVVYSSTSSEQTGKQKTHKLLVVDPQSLEVIGEVEGAYPSTGYALSYDPAEKMLYTAGQFINKIDPISRQVVGSVDVTKADPAITNILGLAVDSANNRVFAAHNIFRSEGEDDGVYVFDLKTGEQLAFVRTGRGSISVSYDPIRNKAYVANFRAGTISVINGKDYHVSRQFTIGPLPNEMALDSSNNQLFVGLKEVYSPNSSTGDFVAGAKERLLKVNLPVR